MNNRLLQGAHHAAGNRRYGEVSGHAPEFVLPAPAQAVRIRHPSWIEESGEGIAGVFSTPAFGLVLAGLGAGLVFYGLPYLRRVSETVRTHTARSAAVGLASFILVVPAFIVLIVVLAVSIIGIPLLLVTPV